MSTGRPRKETDLLQDYREAISSWVPLDLEAEFAQEMNHCSGVDESNVLVDLESKSRRLLELRLLTNYIDRTSKTFGACQHEDVRRAWSIEAPKLAIQHDNLLYQILSMSALHLLRSEPDNPELVVARQTYHGLALREHRRAVAKLNLHNADAVSCTSSLVFMDAFASLQERSMEPYTPPMEWLQLARGAGSIFAVGISALEGSRVYDTAVINAISRHHQYFDNADVMFAAVNRKDLLGLLTQDIAGEPWDEETQQAYEKTLNYIGWVQLTIKDGEHMLGTCRRMMAFAVLAPKKFIEFVQEMRPRALVILAHFFALGSQLRDIWWIGDNVQREIKGIQQVLPPEWQPLMRQPLMRVGYSAV